MYLTDANATGHLSFDLTQEAFYEVVVKSFEANPKRTNLTWKSTKAIHDANLPKDPAQYYP